MVEFRDISKAKNRLLAYYKKFFDSSIFPIERSNSKEYIDSIINEFAIAPDEFLVSEYILASSFNLIVTSQRLIFRRESIVLSFSYDNVAAVFLGFPFKKSEPPHILNLTTKDHRLYEINFLDVTTLVAARNEIYRVINTMILNWEGEAFDASNMDRSGFLLVKLPDALLLDK